MKSKITRGSSFRGAANYVLDADQKHDKRAEIVASNMDARDPRALAAEFGIGRALRPECKKPVWHCSLSLPTDERVSAEQWSEVIAAYLDKIGLSDVHQFIAARHNDTDHDHIHIVVNRVGLNGEIWGGQNDVKKSIQICQELEKQFGLTITKGLDPEARAPVARPSSGEVMKARRTGQEPVRAAIQKAIKAALEGRPTTHQFASRLRAAGVDLKPNIATTGRVNGFSFASQGQKFSGTKLGADFKWSALRQEIDYQPARDAQMLQHLRVGRLSPIPPVAVLPKFIDRAAPPSVQAAPARPAPMPTFETFSVRPTDKRLTSAALNSSDEETRRRAQEAAQAARIAQRNRDRAENVEAWLAFWRKMFAQYKGLRAEFFARLAQPQKTAAEVAELNKVGPALQTFGEAILLIDAEQARLSEQDKANLINSDKPIPAVRAAANRISAQIAQENQAKTTATPPAPARPLVRPATPAPAAAQSRPRF
jgi:hypothetical protein